MRSFGGQTVVYRGNGFFEAVCVTHICLHNIRSGKKCCIHIPNVDPDLRDLMLSVGCTTGEPNNIAVEFFQDEDPVVKMASYSHGWKAAMQGYQGNKDVIAYYMRSDFQPSNPMWDAIINKSHIQMLPFSWNGLQEAKFAGVFTSDWKMRFAMHLMGVPSFLVSGPSWPKDMFKNYGVAEQTCVAMSDNIRIRACPCPSPKVCHQMTADVKPCWSEKILQSSLSAFLRQIGK